MNKLIYWSGVDRSILLLCPISEQHKHARIGALVITSGAITAFITGYALLGVFNNLVISILLGILWGLLILTFTRLIVSFIKMNDVKFNWLKLVISPLILFISLSVVISKPLTLKIFEQEIAERGYYSEIQKMVQLDSLFDHKIAGKRNGIQRLNDQTEERRLQVVIYYEQYKCACEGSCGSGEKGNRHECMRQQQKYEKEQGEYLLVKDANEILIGDINLEIQTLNEDWVKKKTELKSAFSFGLLARLEMLQQLPLAQVHFRALVLILIVISMAPIMAKVISPTGMYEKSASQKDIN